MVHDAGRCAGLVAARSHQVTEPSLAYLRAYATGLSCGLLGASLLPSVAVRLGVGGQVVLGPLTALVLLAMAIPSLPPSLRHRPTVALSGRCGLHRGAGCRGARGCGAGADC